MANNHAVWASGSVDGDVDIDAYTPLADVRFGSSLLTESAKLKRLIAKLPQGTSNSRRDHVERCLKIIAQGRQRDPHFGKFFAELPALERYYWVSTLYTLLISGKRRRELSAYFTPPAISRHVIGVMESHGLSVGRDRILDPASGGAAFLLPLAIRQQEICQNSSSASAIDLVERNLFGIELDPGLSQLSQAMFSDLFKTEIRARGQELSSIVTRGSSLRSLDSATIFDAVLCNPPYGRVFRPSSKLLERYTSVLDKGYVNTYAIFIKLSIDAARYGALIGLVVPTSFISGPTFGKLREYILRHTQILQLDLIDQRQDLFVDVVQDTCVLVLRKSNDVSLTCRPKCSAVRDDGSVSTLGFLEIPVEGRGIWVLPSRAPVQGSDIRARNHSYFNPKLKTLSDYGYVARSGYFVWNRNRDKLAERKKPKKGEVPLLWAHNVKHGCDIDLHAVAGRNAPRKGMLSCVSISEESTAIIRTAGLLVQRTTNNKQARRLVVGYVPENFPTTHGGYVTENHTIVIVPNSKEAQRISLESLHKLFSSKKIDELYRQISGTVSISVTVLRALPLPDPDLLVRALASHEDVEAAVGAAYELTLMQDTSSD